MVKEKIIEQPSVNKDISTKPESKPETPTLSSERLSAETSKTREIAPLAESVKPKVPPIGLAATAVASSFQKRRELAIDNILAEGLSELFLKMKPEEQKRFKEKGEETAAKINILLNQVKVKVDKIVALIRRWLSLVKGINRFFLEQEIKIKTDKIMKIKNKF